MCHKLFKSKGEFDYPLNASAEGGLGDQQYKQGNKKEIREPSDLLPSASQ